MLPWRYARKRSWLGSGWPQATQIENGGRQQGCFLHGQGVDVWFCLDSASDPDLPSCIPWRYGVVLQEDQLLLFAFDRNCWWSTCWWTFANGWFHWTGFSSLAARSALFEECVWPWQTSARLCRLEVYRCWTPSCPWFGQCTVGGTTGSTKTT